jgi:hypothetical protein
MRVIERLDNLFLAGGSLVLILRKGGGLGLGSRLGSGFRSGLLLLLLLQLGLLRGEFGCFIGLGFFLLLCEFPEDQCLLV